MSDPFVSMEKADEKTTKKESNHKGTLNYVSERFNGTFEVEFRETKVDKLLELEGTPETVMVDEKGAIIENDGKTVAIEAHRPWQFNAEGGQVVDKSRTKKILRYEDGTWDPYFDLPKTKTFNINEKRPISEVNLDPADPSVSYGTVIPQEDTEKYAVAKVQQERAGPNSNYAGLASYLKERQLAILYPFTFGRGRNVLTVVEYPVTMDGNTYMVKKFCTGAIVFSWPIVPPAAGASSETAPVAMPTLRIRNRRAIAPS
jgi:hypothetical protein